jgi:hypothetical protein
MNYIAFKVSQHTHCQANRLSPHVNGTSLSVRCVTMRVLLGTMTRIYHMCLFCRIMLVHLIMQMF